MKLLSTILPLLISAIFCFASPTANDTEHKAPPYCYDCNLFDYALSIYSTWSTFPSVLDPEECAIFRIQVVSGTTYTFKTGCGDGSYANFNTQLELLNSNCYQIAYDNDGCSNYASTITYTATYTGFAYLKLSGYSGGAGYYTLAFKEDASTVCNTCPNYDYSYLEPTTSWQGVSSSIISAGCKLYRFEVVSGEHYTFKTGCGDGATASFAPTITLRDLSCNPMLQNIDYCSNSQISIDFTAEYTGFVFIKVSGFDENEFGTFTLKWRKGTPCTAPEVATISATPSTICSGSSSIISLSNVCTSCVYTWSPTTGISIINNSLVYASPTSTTTYTLTGSNGCQPDATSTVTINVNSLPPLPTISQNQGTLTCNQSGYNYQWYAGNTAINGATSQSYNPTQNGSYSVEITNGNNCSRKSNAFSYTTTGINQFNFNFQIYPNPSNGQFVISSEGNILKNTTLSLSNYLGQVVYVEVLGDISGNYTHEINLPQLPAGTYSVEISDNSHKTVKMLVLEK